MSDFSDLPLNRRETAIPPRRSRAIWWLLGGGAAVTFLCCGGVIACIAYLGIFAPETSVYTGNRIPSQFLHTIESVGALDDDETILFFYSDGITDIRGGFYFVSDKKVVIYLQATGDTPLTKIPFDDIREVEIYRNDSFFEDSEITLSLEDGQVLSFPVSSDFNRDQKFFEAIKDRTDRASESQ